MNTSQRQKQQHYYYTSSNSQPCTPLSPSTPFEVSETEFTEFCNVWKMQISIPVLAFEKTLKIIDQYILLKPILEQRQIELQTLLNYNSKLVQTMQTFQVHEKKILDRCNALVKLYCKTFKKYFDSKNKEFDQGVFVEIRSIFDTFSMKNWQLDHKKYDLPKVNLKYKQYLYTILKDHYLFSGVELFDKIQKNLNLASESNSEHLKLWQKLQDQVKEFNKAVESVTIQNMFALYQKKRKIINQIKFFQIECEAIAAQNTDRFNRIKNLKKGNEKNLQNFEKFKSYEELDEGFVKAIKKLHAQIEEVDPVKIKNYLQTEIEQRLRLKKKELKQKKKFQNYHSMLKQENIDLKEEIEQIRQRIMELQKTNSEYKAQIDYMSIKTSMTKKNTSLSQNNMSVVFEDTSFFGDKGPKKEREHVKKLQSEAKKLDELIKLKEKELGSISMFSMGLTEVAQNVDQLYAKFTEMKDSVDQQSDNWNLQQKGLTVSKTIKNSKVSSNSMFQGQSSQKDLDKRLNEIKSKLKSFKTLAEEFSNFIVNAQLKPANNKGKESIALSEISAQALNINQNNSFCPIHTQQILNSSQGSYLNKTEIIQPPKIQTKDISFSEDSQSKSSSIPFNNVGKEKIVKYNEFTLKISEPQDVKRKSDLQEAEDNVSLNEQKENIRKDEEKKNPFGQFEKETMKENEQRIQGKIKDSQQSAVSIKVELPGFLNPIQQESKLQDSKLQKNDSNHFQNSKLRNVDTNNNIGESGSLKCSAQFNQNFTLNNLDSMIKSRKSSESGIGGSPLTEIDSFLANKINEESEQEKNSSSQPKGSQISSKEKPIYYKVIEYKKSKSSRSANLPEENHLQMTGHEGYSMAPHAQTSLENRNESARYEDKSQIQLNKSVFLQAKIKDIETVLVEKESQLQLVQIQLQRLTKLVETLTLQNKQLKGVLEKQIVSKKLENIGKLKQKITVQSGIQQPPLEGKQIASLSMSNNSNYLTQPLMSPGKIEQKSIENQKNFYRKETSSLAQLRLKISSLLQSLKSLQNLQAKNQARNANEGNSFPILKQIFTQFIFNAYVLRKSVEENSQEANIKKAQALLNLFVELWNQTKKKEIEKIDSNPNFSSKPIKTSVKDSDLSQSLKISQSLNIKQGNKQPLLPNHQQNYEHKNFPPLRASRQRLSISKKSESISNIHQPPSQNNPPFQKSFQTPSESYVNKNEVENNLGSFKDEQNNQSISIVKKSDKTFNHENQFQGEFEKGKCDGLLLIEKDDIVAGVLGEENNCVENLLLEGQRSVDKDDVKRNKMVVKRQVSQGDCEDKVQINVIRKPNLSHQRNSPTQCQKSLSKQFNTFKPIQIKASNQTNNKKPLISNEKASENSSDEQLEAMTSISQSELLTQEDNNHFVVSRPLKIIETKKSEGKIPNNNRKMKEKQQSQSSQQDSSAISQVPVIRISRETNVRKSQQGANPIPQINSRQHSSPSRQRNPHLSLSSQISQQSSHNNQHELEQQNQQPSLPTYTEQQYLQLYKKYKATQNCLLLEIQRNHKKQAEYQSYLKQIKMKIRPYSKLTLEQRLFEGQKRIKELEDLVKRQESEFQGQVKKALQDGQRLFQAYLVMLERKGKRAKDK